MSYEDELKKLTADYIDGRISEEEFKQGKAILYRSIADKKDSPMLTYFKTQKEFGEEEQNITEHYTNDKSSEPNITLDERIEALEKNTTNDSDSTIQEIVALEQKIENLEKEAKTSKMLSKWAIGIATVAVLLSFTIPGPQGEQGPKGDMGPQGFNGVPGEKGEPGNSLDCTSIEVVAPQRNLWDNTIEYVIKDASYCSSGPRVIR